MHADFSSLTTPSKLTYGGGDFMCGELYEPTLYFKRTYFGHGLGYLFTRYEVCFLSVDPFPDVQVEVHLVNKPV